ncbi:hypothetical protein VST7929_01283 [Vibrio stylophorae]|uniref:Uncharacterized protein n=1 Tax=Vibrio stylophorae TaxID=659351 RepID=A0ABM8ZTZ8_9VIBR|nr:hypothetical protein [Vibrio stylophorae]CAH0533415.1 hypothetical protein VST7929_01283 [Vibrio stylophorae]
MIEQRNEQIRRREEQEWLERFKNGQLVDYLQGTNDYPYSYARNLLADNYRYEQNRHFLIYNFWCLSRQYDLDTCTLLIEAFSALYYRDKYALLASVCELTQIIKTKFEVDIKYGDEPPVVLISQLNEVAADFYHKLQKCSRDDFELDDDYYEYMKAPKWHRFVDVEFFKSEIEENIEFLRSHL